jgi:hypothetical protein
MAHFDRYEDLSQPANEAERAVIGGVHFAEYSAMFLLGILGFIAMVVAIAVPLIIMIGVLTN